MEGQSAYIKSLGYSTRQRTEPLKQAFGISLIEQAGKLINLLQLVDWDDFHGRIHGVAADQLQVLTVQRQLLVDKLHELDKLISIVPIQASIHIDPQPQAVLFDQWR